MDFQCVGLKRKVACGQKLLLFVMLAVFIAGPAHGETKQYQGNGVSFEYPAQYGLTEKSKKSSRVVALKNGNNTIDIEISKNALIDGFDELVIKNFSENFKAKGFGVSDVQKEKKQIPLKVKGESEAVQVEAVKFNETITVKQQDVTVKILQTMFFFSYNDQGYTVNYMRTKGKYSDLVTVLSSFTFDEKEMAEDAEKAAVF